MLALSLRATCTLLALCCLLLSAPVRAQARLIDETSELTALLALIRERLLLMPAVATYKWQYKLPVLDPARDMR